MYGKRHCFGGRNQYLGELTMMKLIVILTALVLLLALLVIGLGVLIKKSSGSAGPTND